MAKEVKVISQVSRTFEFRRAPHYLAGSRATNAQELGPRLKSPGQKGGGTRFASLAKSTMNASNADCGVLYRRKARLGG